MAGTKAVLEFGTSKIICMIDTSSMRDMDIPAASCIRYEGIFNGSWVNADAVPVAMENAVIAAEKKCSRQVKSVKVGVPTDFSLLTVKEASADVPTTAVTTDLIRHLAESCKPKAFSDYQLIEVRPVYFMDAAGELYVDLPVGIRTKRLSAMFSYFYAKKDFVIDVTSMLNDMHIHITRFLNESRKQAVKYIPERSRFSTAILVDVGYTETIVSVIYNDAVIATDLIYMGGENIVKDLSKNLHIDTQIAESLKRGHVFGLSIDSASPVYGRADDGRMIGFNQSVVRNIIEDRMYDLCRAISVSISGFSRKRILSRNADIFLTGSGIVMKGADTFLRNTIGRNVYPVKNTRFSTFPAVYNTAFSLLDNDNDRDYDLLCSGVYQGQITSKLGKIFK